MEKLGNLTLIPEINIPGRIEMIIDSLFPQHTPRIETETSEPRVKLTIMKDKLTKAAMQMKLNRVLGPDGITNETLKVFVRD